MPLTRCARRKRAHRQASARAGAAPQRNHRRALAALRGVHEARCGHVVACRVLRSVAGAAGAAERGGRGCCTAGNSVAELGDGTQLVRASVLTPSCFALIVRGIAYCVVLYCCAGRPQC